MKHSLIFSTVASTRTWLRYLPGPCLRRALCLVAITGVLTTENRGESPGVWLNHFQLGALAGAQDSDWAVTREGLDTAFFAINTLWPMAKPMKLSITPAAAAAAAEKLHKNGIKIGVECGYFDHQQTLKDPGNAASDVIPTRELPRLEPGVGIRTARIEIAKLRSLWQAGHQPDYIVLDDPMRRLTIPGQDNPAQLLQGMADYGSAALEVVSYMQVMREKFPAVQFVIIMNFPNWGWKGKPAFLTGPGRTGTMNWGDANLALEALFPAVEKAGQSIYALQGDFPWRYFAEQPTDAIAATVDWPERILQLESYARDKGTRFNLTANSETGYVSAQAFSADSLKYLDAYLAAGGKPDNLVVQSWYPHPVDLLPESEPHTGTWLSARFIERLREIKKGSAVAAEPPKLRSFDRTEPEALLNLLKHLDPTLHGKVAPEVLEKWLGHPEDPPASLASKLLLTLRGAAAQSTSGKPKATVLMRDNDAKAALGLPPISITPGHPQIWVIEVVSAASESAHVTAWTKRSKAEPMAPVWIAPGSSRLLAVAIDPASARNGAVELCIGTKGKRNISVSIPIKMAH